MKSHQALLDQQYACIYLTIVLVEAKRKVKLCWNILLYNYNPCRNVATVFKSLYANDTHCNSSAWKADAVYQWRFDSSHTGKLAEDDRAVNCRRFNSLCLHHWQSLCFVWFTMLMSTLFQITHWEPTNRTTHKTHTHHTKNTTRTTHTTRHTQHTQHTTNTTHSSHHTQHTQHTQQSCAANISWWTHSACQNPEERETGLSACHFDNWKQSCDRAVIENTTVRDVSNTVIPLIDLMFVLNHLE